jgi:hypothetical protein
MAQEFVTTACHFELHTRCSGDLACMCACHDGMPEEDAA